jgi:hypothetical protein
VRRCPIPSASCGDRPCETLQPAMSRLLQRPKETIQQRLDRLGLNSTVLVKHTAQLDGSFHVKKLAPPSQAHHNAILKHWRGFADQQRLTNTEIMPGLAVPSQGM